MKLPVNGTSKAQHEVQSGENSSSSATVKMSQLSFLSDMPGAIINNNANGGGKGLSSIKTNKSHNHGHTMPYNQRIERLETSTREVMRQKAIDEANAVMTSQIYISDGSYLDNFNLLGVVTTPRTLDGSSNGIGNTKSVSGAASDSPRKVGTGASGSVRLDSQSSAANDRIKSGGNGQQSSIKSEIQGNKSNATNGNVGGSSSMLDAKFFSTMSESISKEIVSLNSTLYSYSQNYLGHYASLDGHYSSNLDFETELSLAGYDDTPSSQRQFEDLPAELVELDLTTVEAYLRKCGRLAQKLKLSSLGSQNDASSVQTVDDITNHENFDTFETDEGGGEIDPLKSVPETFFSQYFDLTDPKTFESLLVLEDNEVQVEDVNGDIVDDGIQQIVRIQKPEKFTQHLDAIELALLNQVRSKSDSFFRETNRFSYLKSLVADSVEEVGCLRSELEKIRERRITDAEMIPIMDRRRNDIRDLGNILDEIGDVLEVKSSVAGLIAAGDYLGAVDAIQMARQLLNGEQFANEINHSSNENEPRTETRHVLRKLTALNKVNDQLSQYETLVVMDLSNKLVESFLSWNSASLSSIPSFQTTDQLSNVKNTILAMKKCRKLSMIADIYREKLCETIRVTIRTTVSECASDAAKDSTLLPTAAATIVSIPEKDNANFGKNEAKSSIIEGVTSMSFTQFMECLDLIYENVLSLLKSASGVNKFCLEEGISFKDEEIIDSKGESNTTSTPSALFSGADLSHRSISEILRLRKEAHSLITFEEMRRLWDSCLAFTLQIDKISGQKVYVLRSTLLAQAKAFVERKHEASMSSLAAALDSERWTQCDVSSERQNTLDRLCSGRAVLSSARDISATEKDQVVSSPFASVEGKHYRIVWSSLLLIEMVMGNVACAAHFQNLATNVVAKVCELLRLFNSRATQLVLGAGAIHSSARLKSINAKHLALVTQCVGVVKSILPHIRAALMAQLPNKQHTLLLDLDKIKREYADHHDKVLSKFVSIIGGIVEHSLIARIKDSNFEERSKLDDNVDIVCCPFLDGVITNTRKMHQVLISLLPNEDLMDVFSRIFAHLDSKIPKIFLAADSDEKNMFSLPQTLEGKRRIIVEVETMAKTLNNLPEIRPWDYGAMEFISRRLEIQIGNGKDLDNDGDDQAVQNETSTVENVISAADTESEQINKGSTVIMEMPNIDGKESYMDVDMAVTSTPNEDVAKEIENESDPTEPCSIDVIDSAEKDIDSKSSRNADKEMPSF